jgi:hypothetical protein
MRPVRRMVIRKGPDDPVLKNNPSPMVSITKPITVTQTQPVDRLGLKTCFTVISNLLVIYLSFSRIM